MANSADESETVENGELVLTHHIENGDGRTSGGLTHRESRNGSQHHGSKRNTTYMHVSRPVYTERDFQKHYKRIDRKEDEAALKKFRRKCKDVDITPNDVRCFLLRLVPIFKWLPAYDLRNNLLGDVTSGITVAIMRMPQAMAYAILATLPAVYGLYVAFFSVLVYAILGTSRHISVGTWSIASIMTGAAIDTIVTQETDTTPPNSRNNEDDATELRIQVAVSLCLLIGVIQVAMSVMRLGIVTIYLSEPLVKGFTTGAAVHVFTSQFPKLFGIKTARFSGPFAQVYTYVEFFSKLSSVNTCAVVMSIVSLLLLVCIGEINDRQAAKGWCRPQGVKGRKLPLPSELLVVLIATTASYMGDYERKYNLSVVGDIPTGLPLPVVPPSKYLIPLIGPAFAIAIVGFAISISMAQLFAKRHNYEVDPNQELIAYGCIHLVGAFFQCFPNATAMSRTAVQEGAGGRTQLAGIISSMILLIIILWLGPLFTQLPECVLASIIVIALRGMFRQIPDLRLLWKVSGVDFLLWIVTFTLVVFLGVDLGLVLGVIFALLTVVVRSAQSPSCVVMGQVPDTEIYRDVSTVQGVEELRGIKIFQCSASLNYINATHFRDSLYDKVGVNPKSIMIARKERRGKKHNKTVEHGDEDVSMAEYTIALDEDQSHIEGALDTVVIECSMFKYVDVVGVKALQDIVTEYDAVSVRVVFSGCTDTVRKALLTTATINKAQAIGLDRMYVSIHDAVLSSSRESPPRTHDSCLL